MICEGYREGLMALLDGELTESERPRIEDHLCHCPECHDEYQRYEKLLRLTRNFHYPEIPRELRRRHYWGGICRRLRSRNMWACWIAAACGLIIAGNLMIFGFPPLTLAPIIGAAACFAGTFLMWLSYFCSRKRI